jgi:hypothetical protein
VQSAQMLWFAAGLAAATVSAVWLWSAIRPRMA